MLAKRKGRDDALTRRGIVLCDAYAAACAALAFLRGVLAEIRDACNAILAVSTAEACRPDAFDLLWAYSSIEAEAVCSSEEGFEPLPSPSLTHS